MSCPITDHEASTQTLALLSQLENAFQAELDIYRRGINGWQPLTGETDRQETSCALSTKELNDWLEDLADQSPVTPQFKSLGGQAAMLAAWSVGADGTAEIVAGRIALDAMQLAGSVAVLATRCAEVAEQGELLNQYASRLSASFEELSFLRRLSQHVELCMANRSLSDITQVVLPSLRALVGVETLCLICAETDANTGRHVLSKVAGVVGELPYNLDFWQDMIDGLQQRKRKVVVRNFFGQLAECRREKTSLVKSLVLAPVQKDDKIFGWLLAVNKTASQEAQEELSNFLGHDELGSMEASLLESAALMLGSHAANNQLFCELELLVVEVIHTLVGVVEAKDAYTCGHSHRVALIAKLLATQMQLPDPICEEIYSAGLLHDIGKVGVVDDVLLKKDKLSDEEFDQIKQHPVIGAKLLHGLKPLVKLVPGVLYHHEAFDGSGYPHGLVGDNIPLIARVLAVADAWDAMTSDRPYRSGMPIERATAILQEGAGKQWDRQVVDAFLQSRAEILAVGNLWRRNMSEFCLLGKLS